MARFAKGNRQMGPDSDRKTYNVEEAGRLLGVGRNQAYEAARRGEIPTIKIGKRLLVPRAALDRMLDPDTKAA
jgi:excisionase family DNA binding protein